VPQRDPNRLPTSVVPSHYELHLVPDLDAATFSGTQAVTVEVHESVDELVLHALDLEIDRIWLERDGQRIEAAATLSPETETVEIALAEAAGPGAWVLHSEFRGELNDKLVGFYRSTFVDHEGQTRVLACTQFESTHARRAFPCWDEPAFKATWAITLDVPEDLMAISNGAEISSEPLGDGVRRVRFATTMSMSSYLVAFVVGPLEATETVDVNGTPLRVIAPIGKADLTSFALEVGEFSLRFLADWYAIAYPGDKLDLVAIPDFSFGAMENLGCVTFRESALLLDRDRSTQAEQQRVADVIAHEIAHMWFGDLVTMGWWNGIWLNEAFATFMEMLTTDAYRPEWHRWVDFGTARSAAFDTDSLSTTRPIEYVVITAADSEGMFDVLTYEKGASVVRMLQQYLGEDRFQEGIRLYLRTHSYANTETTDLWDAIEQASGEPVRQIMDTWIFQAGHPAVAIERGDDDKTLRLSQAKFKFRPDPASGIETVSGEPQAVPVVVRTGHDGGAQVHKVLLEGPTAEISLDTVPDWVVGNHEGNGFYRVELSDEDLALVGSKALTELTALERYGLVEDEWAAILAGRSSISRLTGLLRSLSAETDVSVWQRMIGVLGGLDRACPPEAREDLATWARGLIGPALAAVGPRRRDGEDDRTTALRAALFEAAARLGRDRHQIETAHDEFARLGASGGGTEPRLDPDMADAVVRVVAADADEATWGELRRRAGVATTPQDRLRHQGALADTDDPALIERLCGLVLSDEIRTQDGLFILRRALANRDAHRQVWQFVTDNWDLIGTRFPSASLPRLIDGIRPVNDRTLATEIAAFLADHPVPQGELVVRQHVERMWVSVALADRVRAELPAALS